MIFVEDISLFLSFILSCQNYKEQRGVIANANNRVSQPEFRETLGFLGVSLGQACSKGFFKTFEEILLITIYNLFFINVKKD